MNNYTTNDLKLFINETIKNALIEIKSNSSSKLDNLIPRKELKKKLCVSEQTITQWKKRGLLISYSVGRKDFFLVEDILRIMKGGIK